MLLNILLNGVNDSLEGAQQAAAAAADTAQQAAGGAARTGASGGPFFIIVYILFLVVIFYLFIIRPNKKRENEREAMRSKIEVGNWVVTSSGLYGKVVSVYADEFLVEFGVNKGVNIPVAKSEIVGVKEPGLSSTPAAEEIEDAPKKKKFGIF